MSDSEKEAGVSTPTKTDSIIGYVKEHPKRFIVALLLMILVM
jgi:hypothetical protein